MRNAQIDFFESLGESRARRLSHGGMESRGHRKRRRPFISGRPFHIVFKSSKARGALSFRGIKNHALVELALKTQAKRHGVRLMSYVIMSNHLHIKIKASVKRGMQNFLRRIGSIIAQGVTKARKGRPFGKFWEALVFSRVLSSRSEELILERYFEANRIEAHLGYKARQVFLMKTRRKRSLNTLFLSKHLGFF